jgi:hypothetical protein
MKNNGESIATEEAVVLVYLSFFWPTAWGEGPMGLCQKELDFAHGLDMHFAFKVLKLAALQEKFLVLLVLFYLPPQLFAAGTLEGVETSMLIHIP